VKLGNVSTDGRKSGILASQGEIMDIMKREVERLPGGHEALVTQPTSGEERGSWGAVEAMNCPRVGAPRGAPGHA